MSEPTFRGPVPTRDVHVLVMPTSECHVGPTDLTAAERSRAARLSCRSDRLDFMAARYLARVALGKALDIEPGAVRITQACPECGSPEHGRPSVFADTRGPMFVSWSHGAGLVAAAASRSPVGVDVERKAGRGLAALPVFALTAREQRAVSHSADPELSFLRLWTGKEALVKVGFITLDDFPAVDLSGGRDRIGDWEIRGWIDQRRSAVVAVAAPRSGSELHPPC